MSLMKSMKIYKHHYDYKMFDTNIPQYVEYIVNLNRNKMEQVNHIINSFIQFAYSFDDRKITYQMFYNFLQDEGYSMHDIKDSYQQLKDIMLEHNNMYNSPSRLQHEIDKKVLESRINDKKSFDSMTRLVDTFGATTIETGDKKYVLSNVEKIRRKK